MKQGRVIALFGDSMAAKSAVVTVQRRLNCYFENRPDGDKTRIACFGRPGLKPAFSLAGSGAPARGLFGTQTALYACVDDQFEQINPADGSILFSAMMQTDAGYCELATNDTQVVLVDGAAGYLYQNGTFTQLPQPFPSGATTVTYCSDFFLVNNPGTQQFYQSNANDGSTWNALQVAAASAYSDLLLAVDNLMGNLALFSQQHVEFWQNVGNSPVAFQPILSAVSMFGLAALASRAKIADSICFLGQNREGQIQVCQAQGFGVKVISTPDLDYRLNRLSTFSDAVGLVYGIDAHKFYVLTFPTANLSFQWDATTGLWSDIQSGVSTVQTRFNAQYAGYYGGKQYLTDPQTSQVYTMDPLTYTDNGESFAIELVTRHVNSNFDKLWPAQLYLDMETGVGLQTGQGSNPQIMIQYSKDNGRTWSGERWRGLGKIGQYKARVLWRRFGCTRDATWKIRMTDPVKFVIAQAALKMRVRTDTPVRRAA